MASSEVGSAVRWLRQRFTETGMRPTELARRVGRSRSLMSHVLAGRREITPDLAVAISRVWPEFFDHWTGELKAQADRDGKGGEGDGTSR